MNVNGHRSRLGKFSRFGIILLLLIVAVWLVARRDRSNPSETAQHPTESSRETQDPLSVAVPTSRSSSHSNLLGNTVVSQSTASNASEDALPERVQTWLRERLTPESFAAGIALLKDASLSEQARLLVLDKLHSWRRHLTPDNLKALFTETELLAKDANLPNVLRSRAVSAMATILVVLQEQKLLSRQEVGATKVLITPRVPVAPV